METLVKVQKVTKEYKMSEVTVKALDEIDFEIYEGEFIVVLGPSGSGKSTVLNIIGGIDTPTSGSILYKNEDIGNMNQKELTKYRRNNLGFVFQFYNLIPNLTAKENIQLAGNLSKNPIDTEVLIENVDLVNWKNHFPAQLSGGQQQRIAIARAVAKNPDILLCDEPTGALDFKTGIQVLTLLKNFNKTYKKTVIIITHNISIGNIADRVLYIRDGKVDKVKVNEKPLSPTEVIW